MKTLFQAYHHRTLAGRVSSKDSLPDVTKKGDSVVSFASGNKFQYGFKAGNTQTVDLKAIAKQEKGAAFLANLRGSQSSGPGKLQVAGGAKAKKSKNTPSKGARGVTKAITKGNRDAKKSVARVSGTKV